MPNRYNYTFNEVTGTYNFTTKNKIEYKVAFIVDETLDAVSDISINNVYQVIIEKISDVIEPYDRFVANTIDYIVKSFFNTVENSLIYICSEEEEKAGIRFKVFDKWYQNSSFNKSVTKIDNIIHLETENSIFKLYTSLLYHNSNPNIEHIIKAYKNIEAILNSK